MARTPSRLFSRDRKICCYGDVVSTIFLLVCFCALLPTCRFSFFFSSFSDFFPCTPVCLSPCPFVCTAAICYSQQVGTTYSIARVLFACAICTLRPILSACKKSVFRNQKSRSKTDKRKNLFFQSSRRCRHAGHFFKINNFL